MRPPPPALLRPSIYMATTDNTYSRDFIDRVLAATDFAAVYGRYTTLKRRGNRLVGLCPFHKEKTPSFTVDPERGLYHCFGCGVGGDVFRFLKEIGGQGFLEALEFLAKEAGMEIPARTESARRSQGLGKAAEFATKFFQKALESKLGNEAVEYLKKRGISESVWREYRIGWAPADRKHLIRSIKKARLETDPFITIDVLRKDDRTGNLYTVMAESLVFPIPRPGGSIAGFARRRIKEDADYDGPKYINSSDNDLYHKSSVLYGLPQARTDIRKSGYVILVEGYFDVLALAENGISNVVATCGTALTDTQANILARYSRRVVILFDGDLAGVKAAHRSLERLLGAGLEVDIVTLPVEDDPDSLVRREGADSLFKIIEGSPEWFDWLLDLLSEDSVHSDVNERTRLADGFAIPISAIPDDMVRNMFIRKLALHLGTSEENLREHIKKSTRKIGEAYSDENEEHGVEKLHEHACLELALLACMARFELKADYSVNPLHYYPGLWEPAVSGASPRELISQLADERAISYITGLLMEEEPENPMTHMEALFKKILTIKIERDIARTRAELYEAEKKDDRKKIEISMKQIIEMISRLRNLKPFVNRQE